MKQIFTLFTAVAVFFTVQANAQTLSQNFDGANAVTALQSNCWQITGMTAQASGITNQSLASAGASNSSFATPYFDFISGNTVNVSFQITIDKPLANQASRTITIGTKDKNGNVVNYGTPYTYTKTTLKTNDLYTLTANINTGGTFRIFVNVTADNGDGNTHIIIDNFQINSVPTYHYGSSPCNTAPTAVDDNLSTFTFSPYSGNVTGNDFDFNGESLTAATLIAGPASTAGTLSFNSDGNFTFSPSSSFAGGPVTFTYTVTDNGYDPRTSNTATVTITFPERIVLPIQLLSFTGSLVNNKAQLKWSVEENETGSHFEIEKSTDGKNFASIGVVVVSNKTGAENYTYTEASELNGEAYYRLKTVNNNKTISQSRIIVLKNSKDAAISRLAVMQNPIASTLAFNYTATKAGVSMINMYNLSGVKVYSTKLNTQAGINSISLSVDNKLTSGAYVLEVVNGLERNISKIIKK